MHNKILPNIYHFIDNLDRESILNYNKDICIIYRNYNCKINVEKLLNFKKFCKKSGLKFLIANEINLAFRLKLDGVYLPSFNKKFNHKQFQSFKNFIIIGSAHNLKEIRIKENQKVTKIFISSLFKENKNFLGINRFKLLSKLTMKEIVVLGGISKKNKKKLSLLNRYDFAGISYFE